LRNDQKLTEMVLWPEVVVNPLESLTSKVITIPFVIPEGKLKSAINLSARFFASNRLGYDTQPMNLRQAGCFVRIWNASQRGSTGVVLK
jgi:hypothetical protein